MTLRRAWTVAALVVVVLLFLHLTNQAARRYERLEHRTDSLNVQVDAYRADSARRQASIDSALAVATAAESAAAVAGRQSARSKRQRDSVIAVARADTGDVSRALFQAVVEADSAAIQDLTNQVVSLDAALVAIHTAFHEADAGRRTADSLLLGMTGNRDAWQAEARRANRIGLVFGFGWTAPSGQWQAYVGVGKRIRLPRLLGG